MTERLPTETRTTARFVVPVSTVAVGRFRAGTGPAADRSRVTLASVMTALGLDRRSLAPNGPVEARMWKRAREHDAGAAALC